MLEIIASRNPIGGYVRSASRCIASIMARNLVIGFDPVKGAFLQGAIVTDIQGDTTVLIR